MRGGTHLRRRNSITAAVLAVALSGITAAPAAAQAPGAPPDTTANAPMDVGETPAAKPAPAPAPRAEQFGSGPCGAIIARFVAAPADSLIGRYRKCVESKGNATERKWLESDLGLMLDLIAVRNAGRSATGKRLTGEALVASAGRLSGAYGTGPGEYNCTTFLITALSDAGYATGGSIKSYINIDFPHYQSLFARRDPHIKGVVTALVASGQGVELTDMTKLQPGDIVQYWYYEGGKLLGHSGIIAAARGGGHYDLLGAHKSVGHVGVLKDLNLAPGSKAAVFAVRPEAAKTPQK